MAGIISRDGRYYVQFRDSGRTPASVRLSLKTRNRRTAEQLCKQAVDAYEANRFDPWTQPISDLTQKPKEMPTAEEVVQAFLDVKAEEDVSEHTSNKYRITLNLFLGTLRTGIRLAAIKPSHVNAFVRAPHLGRLGQVNRYKVLRTFLNWCAAEGLIHENPIDKVKPPKAGDRLPKAISPEQLDALCDCLRADYVDMLAKGKVKPGELVWCIPAYRFGLYSGMRAAELARLKWGHIDFAKRLIFIYEQKSRKQNTIPLTRKLEEVLAAVEPGEPEAYVFSAKPNVTRRSIKKCAKRMSALFSRYRDAAGLPDHITLHSTRHGFCTMLAEKGCSPIVIKESARHASIQTSMRYVSIANNHLRTMLESAFA